MDYPDLIPAGFLQFELDSKLVRYEDEYIIAVRNVDGAVTMTGKPFRDVFIYEEEKP